MGAVCIVFGIALLCIEALGATRFYASAFAAGIWIGAYVSMPFWSFCLAVCFIVFFVKLTNFVQFKKKECK